VEESLAKRLNKRLAESETFDNEGGRGDSLFSLSGGSMPAPPPESGMPTPKGAFARLGLNKKTDYGDFGIGGTGISLETPQGDKINKYAATDVSYKKGNLRAGINKGAGGYSKPNITVGIGGTFKKGGTVSSASKRADGCAVKGKTRGRII
jgi:hypothetical protein